MYLKFLILFVTVSLLLDENRCLGDGGYPIMINGKYYPCDTGRFKYCRDACILHKGGNPSCRFVGWDVHTERWYSCYCDALKKENRCFLYVDDKGVPHFNDCLADSISPRK